MVVELDRVRGFAIEPEDDLFAAYHVHLVRVPSALRTG